jgi:hypothetical protein
MTSVSDCNFNVNKVTFTEPKKTPDGKVRAYLQYDGQRAYFQTGNLLVPWGLTPPYQDEDNPTKPWSVTLQASVGDCDGNPEEKEAQQALADKWFDQMGLLYEKFVEWVRQHSKLLLGKQYKPSQLEVVKALVPELVRKKEDFPRTMRAKIYCRDGKPDVKTYWNSPQDLKVGSFTELAKMLPRGVHARWILVANIWVVSGKAGLTFTAKQLLLTEDADSVNASNFAFKNVQFKAPDVVVDEDDSEESSEEELNAADSDEDVEVSQHESSA